jgi:O-methyltransferase
MTVESPKLAAARAGLEAARAAVAKGPGPDAEALRAAYLDLLKLTLCDLAGSSTTSVGRTPEGEVMAREMTGDQLRLRSAGMDWPLHGLTMVGLGRLDDLQRCVETVVQDGVPGDMIEAGSWRGGASILMRAALDTLGESARTVWVADSFQGFPRVADAEREDDELDVFDFLAVSLAEVKDNFARFGLEDGVSFVPGFFEETMPGLAGRSWAIARLDGDSYEATWLTLQTLYPGLSSGGFLVVDDFGALDECRQAVEEFREQNGISEPLEQVDWTGVRWRKERDVEIGDRPPSGNTHAAAPQPVARPEHAHVPTMAELDLERQVDDLRQRLASAEAELDRLRRSPLGAAKARLRNKLRRG